MIPLRDDVPSRSYPIVNLTLVALNVAAFIYELTLGRELESFIREFGVVPAVYFHSGHRDALGLVYSFTLADRLMPLLTSMFLHGGWLHIGSNMLYLYIFGDNVEDRMGHSRYFLFYLLAGVLASGAHILSNPDSTVPSVGASGAIAGVLGAYLMLYPGARVVTLLPVFIFLQVVEVPALLFLGLWFVQQFFYGALSLGMETAQSGGIAWWAHIGGFVAGAALVWFFRKRRYRPAGRDVWWVK